jgi:hypothetical protein
MENIAQRLNGWGESLLVLPPGDHRDYQATVRRFPSGSVEVVVACTQHMNRMSASRRWSAHDPVKLGREELTDEQQANKVLENYNRSMRRSRQSIRWVNKCMEADHMVTLSYRENMLDVFRLRSDFNRFVRLVHARYPDWKYCAVREPQDRGSLHLHIATHGHQDLKYLRKCWYMALGSPPDVTGASTPGQIDITGPSKRWGGSGARWASDKLSAYMTKYLHKAFEQIKSGEQRYWVSKGNLKPEIEKIWLVATNYVGAIGETYLLTKSSSGSGQVETMWSSEGWQSIWMTG